MDSSMPLLLLLLVCSSFTVKAGLTVKGLRANNLPSVPDAYVNVFCDGVYLGSTNTVKNDNSPIWTDSFSTSSAQKGDFLTFEVYDEDVVSDDLLGSCKTELVVGNYVDETCGLGNGATLYFSYDLN